MADNNEKMNGSSRKLDGGSNENRRSSGDPLYTITTLEVESAVSEVQNHYKTSEQTARNMVMEEILKTLNHTNRLPN